MQKEKKIKENEQRLRNLLDTIKWTNTCKMGAQKEGGREGEAERIFEEILTQNCPN